MPHPILFVALEKLNDLYGKATGNVKEGSSAADLARGVCGSTQAWGGANWWFWIRVCCELPRTLSIDELNIIARAFIEEGYNTNYAAGYHLVRTGVKMVKDTCVTPATYNYWSSQEMADDTDWSQTGLRRVEA